MFMFAKTDLKEFFWNNENTHTVILLDDAFQPAISPKFTSLITINQPERRSFRWKVFREFKENKSVTVD
jgi:hypothetical protein